MIKKFALAAVCAIGLASSAFAASIQFDAADAILEADENRFEVFMTITNGGATADTLHAVKSRIAKSSRLNVGAAQVERFAAAVGHDARPTQALNRRLVVAPRAAN